MRAKTIRRSMMAIGLALQAMSASAQPPSEPAGATQSGADQLQDIIVTARKREESIEKVPVIETVVTGKTLDNYAAQDLKSLAQDVPDLVIGSNIEDFGQQISIRGIGNTTLNATVDQSVSLNIDGMQINQGLAYSTGLFDVGQVEVLEGPQALFYGKSTTGGVISLRSADPTDTTEVIARAGYEFEAEEKRGELIFSGPVSDTLKLRLATLYTSQEGDFQNLAVGIPELGGLTPQYRDFWPQTEYIVRGTALWTPTEKFDARLKLNYDHLDNSGNDAGLKMTSCPNGVGPFFGIQFLSPQDNCQQANHNFYIVDLNPAAYPGIRNNGVPFNDLSQYFGTLEANYHAARDLTFTSVTGFYKLVESDLFNGTETGAAGTLYAFDNNFDIRNLTQELRANSDYDGPFNFTAGAYYQQSEMNEPLRGLYNQFLGLGLPVLFQQGSFFLHTDAYSVFEQMRYKIVPTLEFAAGVRWSHEVRDITEINTGAVSSYPGPGSNIGVIDTGVPRTISDHINPEITLTYTPTNDMTLFGAFKEASKSGGFQTTILQPAGHDLSFSDEDVKGGEVGMKSFFFERRASLNISAYKYEYSNLQAGENVDTAQGLIVRTINTGKADVWGFESSARYLPDIVSGLTLRGAVNYNHARFTSFDNAPCWGGQTIAAGCSQQFDSFTGLYTAQNFRGRPLTGAPDWTANLGFDYERPLPNGMKLGLGSMTHYSDGFYTDLAERYDMIQRAYVKTDVNLRLSARDDRWQVSLVGLNLGDILTTGYCANSPFQSGGLAAAFGLQETGGTKGGIQDGVACAIDRGRELWLRVEFRPRL